MEIIRQNILIEEYNYALPDDLIADFPLSKRDESKLLVYKNGLINNNNFSELPGLLLTNASLILNNTRVIEARIFFHKDTGGVIEIFCLEPLLSMEQAMGASESVEWRCLVGGASKWKHGAILQKELQLQTGQVILFAKYISKEEDAFIIQFSWSGFTTFSEILHAAGNIPLPPYIKRKPTESDTERYQTIFAKHNGSVAAPTAALHFTDKVFEGLELKNIHPDYVTLHVGAGTFKPVKTETIADHQMHGERFSVTDELLQNLINAEKIIAAGTTTLRTLESLHWLGIKMLMGKNDLVLEQWEAYELDDRKISYKESLASLFNYLQKRKESQLYCRTSLLIVPGYRFKSAEALITNFHQPKSTLLLLVAAFIGPDWKKVYDHALENNYRFLSYGDSSLLWRS
jgi:S-adenosylmethionine:tRNA ribosyltransferase-isomerase